MYKKTLITILLICPLFFLLVGYPVSNNSTAHRTALSTSQRCYTVGNFSQFSSCLAHNPKITIGKLLTQTVHDLNDAQPYMGYMFIVFLLGQLLLIPLLVKEIKND